MDKKNKGSDLVRRMMKSHEITAPSADFTGKVMNNIAVGQKRNYAYSPLITKKGWAVLALLLVGLISYLIIYRDLATPSWFGYLDIPFDFLAENEFSGTFVYATLILGLCLFVQIVFIKNHFNKKLDF